MDFFAPIAKFFIKLKKNKLGIKMSENEEESDDFEDLTEVEDTFQETELESDLDESLNYDDYNLEDIAGEREDIQLSKQWYKRIEVDLWKTKLHAATIGIRQKDQYRAQSRQFTANMDVIGDVEFFAYSPEDLNLDPKDRQEPKKVDDYKEIIAINKSFWDHEDESSMIFKLAQKHSKEYDPKKLAKYFRRLVIRTFTELERDKKKKGHAGRWRGTIEESILNSITMTFGEKDPRPFFYLSIPGFNYRVALMRTHTFVGDRYVFTLPNPNTGELNTFIIEGKRATPGDDFEVFLESGERVAVIDDRKLNVGGKVTITFNDEKEYETLNRSTVFRHVLILFSIMLKFMDEINEKYDSAYKALRKKEEIQKKMQKAMKNKDEEKMKEIKANYEKLQKECKLIRSLIVTNSELTLHYNPRRIRT
jgi:hypothetical protein